MNYINQSTRYRQMIETPVIDTNSMFWWSAKLPSISEKKKHGGVPGMGGKTHPIYLVYDISIKSPIISTRSIDTFTFDTIPNKPHEWLTQQLWRHQYCSVSLSPTSSPPTPNPPHRKQRNKHHTKTPPPIYRLTVPWSWRSLPTGRTWPCHPRGRKLQPCPAPAAPPRACNQGHKNACSTNVPYGVMLAVSSHYWRRCPHISSFFPGLYLAHGQHTRTIRTWYPVQPWYKPLWAEI